LPQHWANHMTTILPTLVRRCANLEPTLAGCQSDGQHDVGPKSFCQYFTY
jgi:hypothetical protein